MGVVPARVMRTVIAVAMAVGMVAAVPAAADATPRKFVPPAVQKVPVLPRTALAIPAAGALARERVSAATAAELRANSTPRPDSAWPTAGTAVAILPAMPSRITAAALRVADAAVPVGALPVKVARAGVASGPLSRVSVSILAHTAAARARVAGVLFTVGEAGALRGTVSVTLRYSSFQNAIGADWGYRLHLAELPACALTTPQVPACQVQTPVKTVNDPQAGTLTAQVALATAVQPASLLSRATQPLVSPALPQAQDVLTAVSGPAGSNGSFEVTSLKPSGTWVGGGSSGDFTWSYPITLPPPAAGSAPDLALDYDSSSVDGRNGTTNNQNGMIGEGFSLSDNFIERSYTDCADDPEGAESGLYDQCWAGNVVTMSLNGQSTPLVIDSSGNWHEEYDSGDQIQYETGTSANTNNGTYDNDYWVVTTPDGTQYYFGKNEGPGWASGDPVTNSAWTEPVYGPHPAVTGTGAHPQDPCYKSTGFAASVCNQAWRWNLDFVIDSNGNTTAYYYTPETNYYGADNKTTGVEYDRGGYLAKIQYGLRDESGSIYSPSVDKNAPDQVTFTAAQRCTTSTTICTAANFNATNAADWPDTPQDQACASGATCNNHAPTFWSQMRIDQITTQYYSGSGYTTVDTYALGQSFPASGDPELELNTITRTGYTASGSTLPLPPVDLTYQLLNNRVSGYNSEPAMAHWRILDIESETGSTIDVGFSTGCTSSNIPSNPADNTTLCYPVMGTPDNNQTLDYFDKYVVDDVSVQDGTAGSPSQVTTYDYVGNPAWHYDDNLAVKAADRTYGQFRGYGTVETLTGNPQNITNGTADVQTESETTYYQGMSDDNDTTGINVTDSLGETFNDADALAGLPLEAQTFDGVGGAQLTDSITEQSVVQDTGSEAINGITLQAAMTGVTSERDFTDNADGSQQELTTTTSYDSDGRPVQVDKSGTSIPETCTQTTYDDNTSPSVWIRDAVAEVIIAQQACPSSGGLTGTDIISDVRTFYDGATSLTTPPTAGDPTMVDEASQNNGGTLAWLTPAWTKTYDSSGRVLRSTDARGNPTTIAYTPADGGPLTKTVTTNALSQATTQTFDPGRGSLLTSTTAAGYETSGTYDALGRLTAEWKPGRSQASKATANVTYTYQELQSKPLAVTMNTLVDTGVAATTGYLTSISIYDSLGQLRQTQTAAEGGVTAVSSTVYDSHGWTVESDNKYTITGSPSTSLVSAAAGAINDRTLYAYDGAGRATSDQDYNGTTLTDSVQTVQGGDQVTTIKRDENGNIVGTPAATVTNALGQQTQTIQYRSSPTISAANVVSGGNPQATTLSYNAAGDKTGITDPDGNQWAYTYDLLGNQLTASDPDTGLTTTTYDNDGNVASVTDADGTSVNYTYDADDRKTAEYTGSTTQGSGTEVASWSWDSLEPGLLSYEDSYTSKGVYETGNLGYNAEGQSTGTYVTVPSGQPLVGTYETGYSYSSTGLLLAETPASGGGLPVDSLSWAYDSYGNPVSEDGYDTYVSNAVWTPYNQISQIDLGTGNSAASLSYTYNPQTQATTSVNLSDNEPSPQVDNTVYNRNADQQITSITDTQGASGTAPVETQCFTYDSLSRLTEAWSATDNCATDPLVADSNATVGGPQPYWQSWTFDTASSTNATSLGDIATQIDHAPAGSTAGDNTLTYNYGYPGHAHAVASITTTNSATNGSSTASYSYDADGNTTSLNGTQVSWNYDGTLASVGSDSYVYDADGNELAETNSAGTTLFLPGEQFTANGSATTGMRYYGFGGITIGESTGSTLYWTESNLQGTLTVAVNAFNESEAPVYRTTTPYGTMVAASGTTAWPDNRTFLNDSTSPDTGLVDIGARKFDPATDLFISSDPVLDTGNPQTMVAYTYAADDPVNDEDPSGDWSFGSVLNTVSNIVNTAAPIVDTVALATCWIPVVGEVTASAAAVVNTAAVVVNTVQAGVALYHGDDLGAVGDLGNAALSFAGTDEGGELLARVGKTVSKAVSAASALCGESFTPSTMVVMANGTSVAIAALKTGDKVLATNTKTGKTSAEAVQAVLVNQDKDLYNLKVKTAKGVQVIHTTAKHLFWDPYLHKWIEAAKLATGEQLLTADDSVATADGGTTPKQDVGDMWDLTVPGNNDHDFYVLAEPVGYAGDASAAISAVKSVPVLVHNCMTLPPILGSGNAYSVAFEARLPSSLWTASREAHFAAANKALYEAMSADPSFAAEMEEMIPGVTQGVAPGPRGAFKRSSPSVLWTWHHAAEPGVMQLVPAIQHETGGIWQTIFHAGGAGGFSIWGPGSGSTTATTSQSGTISQTGGSTQYTSPNGYSY
jgi:RHS repeat-associated protein